MILNNKQKNFIKYFLPILASILTFVTIGQFYSSKLNESDLKEVIGKVTSIKKDRYRHHKYTDDRITIFIEGHSEPFYFFENNIKYFYTIMENITEGELISIKHRTKFQSIIGTGSEFKILKLTKNKTVLYSFENTKENFWNVGKFGFWTSLAMWLLYAFLRIKYKFEKGST